VFALARDARIAPFRKARSYVQQANTPLPDRLQSYNFLERVNVTEVFAADFLSALDLNAPRVLFRERYADAGTTSELDSMLYLDWKFTLADNDIRKVDKACGLAGVPVCFPFLDDDVVEFSTRVPPNLKLKGLKLRYFFKRAMRGFLPNEILKKSKHGFGLPFGVWLRTDRELQQLAYDSLSHLKAHHYFRPAFIDELIHLHRRGHAAFYGGALWVFMALSLWLQAHSTESKRDT
jgi:asparagine synthase (glutamine-hydrolysing)